MSDVDELEGLLSKALRQKTRAGWIKVAVVAISTSVAAFTGASKAAVALLAIVRNIATKDDVAALMQGQQKQIEDLQAGQRACFDRLVPVESNATTARECCREQSKRVDILFNQPLRVR